MNEISLGLIAPAVKFVQRIAKDRPESTRFLIQEGVVNYIFSNSIKIISIIILLLSLSSCSRSGSGSNRMLPGSLKIDVSENFTPLKINNIVILPLHFNDASLKERAKLLDINLDQVFGRETSFEIVEYDQSLAQSSFGQEVIAQKIAEKYDLQGVLFGTIHSYQEQGEKEYTEANVDFSLSLWDSKQRIVVWSARYRDQFKPLSENLFQLPRALRTNFKASSSVELAIEGFSKAARDIEKRRAQTLQNQRN